MMPGILRTKHAGVALVALLTALFAAPAHGETSSPRHLGYEGFVAAVDARHPERALDERMLARAGEIERRSGLLADPELKVGRDQVPLPGALQPEPKMAEMARGNAQWQIALSQSFPWPGALSAEERAASARKAGVATAAGLAALRRRFEAKELYLRLVRTAKLIEVERAAFDVVEGIRTFLHEKFKQGAGSHYDYLQAHRESGMLAANIAALEVDRQNLERHALLLMDAAEASRADAITFDLAWPRELLEAAAPPAGVTDLARERIILDKAAELARQDAEYRLSLPSFMASGMLMQEDSGMRMYGAMVGITLPLQSSARRRSLGAESGIVEGQRGAELAWHDKRKALALVQAESRLAQLEATCKSLERDIIPPVEEHMEAATVEFSQGRGSLSSVIEGRRALLDLELTEVRMTEALALARLSVEKIQAGFVDEAIDLELPQLTGLSGGSMRMGSGTGMEGMPSPGRKARKPAERESLEVPAEEPAPSGSSSMGM